MMKAYRLLTGPDDSSFCHKVTEALANGWELYGSPVYSFHANKLEMYCAQAVVKEVEATYSPDLKLGGL